MTEEEEILLEMIFHMIYSQVEYLEQKGYEVVNWGEVSLSCNNISKLADKLNIKYW